MDIKMFDKVWKESSKMDSSTTKDLWNLRAKEFNEVEKNHERKERINSLLEFFQQKNIINKDSEVLDIGCGSGQYSIEFSKKVKKVVGIDISSKMIENAIDNIEKENINNISLNLISWENCSLEEMGWNKKFDLVFASMCPGINSLDTLLKMNDASKGYCFLSGFVHRIDNVRDKINKILSKDTSPDRWGIKIICAFNILWQLGIHPEIHYRNVEFERNRSMEDAVNIYTLYGKENPDKHDEIKTFLKSISKNGIVQEKTRAKIGWLIWKA